MQGTLVRALHTGYNNGMHEWVQILPAFREAHESRRGTTLRLVYKDVYKRFPRVPYTRAASASDTRGVSSDDVGVCRSSSRSALPYRVPSAVLRTQE